MHGYAVSSYEVTYGLLELTGSSYQILLLSFCSKGPRSRGSCRSCPSIRQSTTQRVECRRLECYSLSSSHGELATRWVDWFRLYMQESSSEAGTCLSGEHNFQATLPPAWSTHLRELDLSLHSLHELQVSKSLHWSQGVKVACSLSWNTLLSVISLAMQPWDVWSCLFLPFSFLCQRSSTWEPLLLL